MGPIRGKSLLLPLWMSWDYITVGTVPSDGAIIRLISGGRERVGDEGVGEFAVIF